MSAELWEIPAKTNPLEIACPLLLPLKIMSIEHQEVFNRGVTIEPRYTDLFTGLGMHGYVDININNIKS